MYLLVCISNVPVLNDYFTIIIYARVKVLRPSGAPGHGICTVISSVGCTTVVGQFKPRRIVSGHVRILFTGAGVMYICGKLPSKNECCVVDLVVVVAAVVVVGVVVSVNESFINVEREL
jgi:hypothetical protein